MSKKYEFTGKTKNYKGRLLHRIRRISDGLVGGWIEKEENLSHEGRIVGQISQAYKDIFQHQCKNRVLTTILTEDDEILYSIGCQNNITKEVFLNRIHNEDGGLEENPHREEYLKLIPLIEQYFKN